MSLTLGISCSVFGCRPPVADDFAQIRGVGISHVELCVLSGWADPSDGRLLARIARWVEKYDLVIHAIHGPSGWPGSGHWLADPDDERRARSVTERVAALRWAADLGAKYMVVEYECYPHAPYWPHETTISTRYPRAAALWAQSFTEIAAAAARTGVRLAVENIDGLSCAGQAERLAAWDADLVGVCFDSSHATYGDDLFGELDQVVARVIGTHLSDNDGLAGNLWADRHWYPFTGVIEWPRLLETLSKSARCECLIVEVLCDEHRITPALVESLERLRSLLPAH